MRVVVQCPRRFPTRGPSSETYSAESEHLGVLHAFDRVVSIILLDGTWSAMSVFQSRSFPITNDESIVRPQFRSSLVCGSYTKFTFFGDITLHRTIPAMCYTVHREIMVEDMNPMVHRWPYISCNVMIYRGARSWSHDILECDTTIMNCETCVSDDHHPERMP